MTKDYKLVIILLKNVTLNDTQVWIQTPIPCAKGVFNVTLNETPIPYANCVVEKDKKETVMTHL